VKASKKQSAKIVRLLARQTCASSDEPYKKFGACTVMGPFKAQCDFTLQMENGDAYQIGLVTNDPPAIEWFQKDFTERPQRYQKIR